MPPTELQTELPVDHIITADHRAVDALLEQCLDEPAGPAPREVVRQLVMHAEAEEALVYPLVGAEVPDGSQLAGHAIDEHQRIEQLLKELDDAIGLAPVGTPDERRDQEVTSVVRRLAQEVRHHVAEEESKLLPALVAQVDEERRRELGARFQAQKEHGPTRPHPLAPDSGPFNAVAGAAAAPLDRWRDSREDNARVDAARDGEDG